MTLYVSGADTGLTDQAEVDAAVRDALAKNKAWVLEVDDGNGSYSRIGNDVRLMGQSPDKPIADDLRKLLTRKRP